MLSIAVKNENGNGHAAEHDPKRERRNNVRRVRRKMRKDGMDLHYHDGEYYPVPIHPYAAIDLEEFGRRIGAIYPIGICVCSGAAWHRVEGVELCDQCAREVQ